LSYKGNDKLTDFQVKCILTSEDIPFEKLRPDKQDLLFIDNNNEIIPYWIEKVDSTEIIIWLKFSEIIPGRETFWLYYGNGNFAGISDGEETFDFFDDFSGSAVDESKWNNYIAEGYFSIHDSLLELWPDIGNGASARPSKFVSKKSFPPQDYVIRTKQKSENMGDVGHLAVFGWSSNNDGSDKDCYRVSFNPSGSRDWDISINGVVAGSVRACATCCDNQYNQNVFYIFELRNIGNTLKAFVDDVEKLSVSDDYYDDLTSCYVGVGDWNTVHFFWDWILLRKYNEIEPVIIT